MSGPAAHRPHIDTVTLLTGDRVRLTTQPDGTTSVVPIAASGRNAVAFSVRDRGGAIEVVPSDAAPLLLAGRLDDRLFDVTGLVAAGYADADTDRLPLIVRHATDRLTAAAAPRGAVVQRALTSVSATAMTARKQDVNAFWRWMTGTTSAAADAGAVPVRGAETPAARTPAAGVEKVWLDAPVRASLDRSVPQTGAPAAWNRGLTGKGVKVAVLDTGIDTDHPDLRDAVVASRSFVTGNADDRNGHGTHVASTITGSGAASGGTSGSGPRYVGVAPQASLLNAKVLDDSAGGTESGVIAGMEWAVAQGARIANLSLSSYTATDGLDPVSLALDRLTAEKGTLFVVAAGNAGPAEQSISSPGSADAALTVAAVDRVRNDRRLLQPRPAPVRPRAQA